MRDHENSGDGASLYGKVIEVEVHTVGWYEVPIADETITLRVIEVTEPRGVPCGVRTLFGDEYNMRVVGVRIEGEMFRDREYIFWTVPEYSQVEVHDAL